MPEGHNKMKVKIDSMLTISNATQEQLNKIIQDNTYKNPEYQNAINMNRSTYKIDRYIKTYTFDGSDLIVPRGYLHELPEHQVTDNTTTVPVTFSSPFFIITKKPCLPCSAIDINGFSQ